MSTSDLDRCYFCDATDELEEHHIVPQRFRGGDGRQNLVTLCHDCHWKLERLYNKDFYEALGIEDPRTSREKHIVCDIHGCTNQATERISKGANDGKRGATWYRCEEHLEKEPDEEFREVVQLFENNPNKTFRPEDVKDRLTDIRMPRVYLRDLRSQDFLKKFGDSYTLHPDIQGGNQS